MKLEPTVEEVSLFEVEFTLVRTCQSLSKSLGYIQSASCPNKKKNQKIPRKTHNSL